MRILSTEISTRYCASCSPVVPLSSVWLLFGLTRKLRHMEKLACSRTRWRTSTWLSLSSPLPSASSRWARWQKAWFETVHCSTVVVHGYITYVIRLLNEAFFMFTEGCSALLTKATGHDLPHVQPWLWDRRHPCLLPRNQPAGHHWRLAQCHRFDVDNYWQILSN